MQDRLSQGIVQLGHVGQEYLIAKVDARVLRDSAHCTDQGGGLHYGLGLSSLFGDLRYIGDKAIRCEFNEAIFLDSIPDIVAMHWWGETAVELDFGSAILNASTVAGVETDWGWRHSEIICYDADKGEVVETSIDRRYFDLMDKLTMDKLSHDEVQIFTGIENYRTITRWVSGRDYLPWVFVLTNGATADNMATVADRLDIDCRPLVTSNGRKLIGFADVDTACLFNLALDVPGTVIELTK